MNKLEFATITQARTKSFAIEVIKFYGKLPKSEEARVIGRQLLRSGTSVASNYRALCRSKSGADFIHKLGTVVEETDETMLWLELLEEAAVCPVGNCATLKREAQELIRVFQTSLNTAKRNAGR
jgi:four helix bundle protein